jgi:tetratricopeptide (TPR) repeat protein
MDFEKKFSTNKTNTFLFMPTSPVHVASLALLRKHLSDWRFCCLLINPRPHYANGIQERCQSEGIEFVEATSRDDFETFIIPLPDVVGIGAVFETWAVALFAWAKHHALPVIAIEEVVQLGLNNKEIDNYDLPFDRLFAANYLEKQYFTSFNHPPDSIRVTGLLPDVQAGKPMNRMDARRRLGIPPDKKVILYTTSPLRWRLSLTSRDDRQFRRSVLQGLAKAADIRDIAIVVKLHPNENRERESAEIQAAIPGALVLGVETDIHAALAAADIVVNRGNSQTVLQAAKAGLKLVIVACGMATVFHRYGGALIVENLAELPETILKALDEGTPSTDNLIDSLCYETREGSANTIARELAEIAKYSAPPGKEIWEWLLRTAIFHMPHDIAKYVCRLARGLSPLVDAVDKALESEESCNLDLQLQCWHYCAELDPEWFYPHKALASVLFKKGDVQETTRHVNIGLEKLPHYSKPLHEVPLRLILVRQCRQLGDFTGVEKHLHPLIEQNLGEVMPEVTLERAFLHFAENDLEACRRDVYTALATLARYPLSPEEDNYLSAGAHNLLGYLHMCCGNGSPNRKNEFLPSHSSMVRTLSQKYLEISSKEVKGDATILIAARNAERTIGRAVRSALKQGNFPVLLIDDHSTDDTVAIARKEDPEIFVVRPPFHGMLGFTRQHGLAFVRTPFAVWLDADDELLPGRVDRLIRAMKDMGTDLAFDSLELVDGQSGVFQRNWMIPDLLCRPPYLYSLFGRNLLPGVGQVAFRTEVARMVQYDPEMHGTEDTDIVLRALAVGARVSLVSEVGYRMHTYPASVSRSLGRQRDMYRKVLLKYDYADVKRMLLEAGANKSITAWTLVSMAIFREEYPSALVFLEEAANCLHNPRRILEPDGICPLPEGWRLAYHRGTLNLLLGNIQAARQHLAQAERLYPTAEGANNLGVALALSGDTENGRICFYLALSIKPDYLDARLNLESETPSRITSHPLRHQPARDDYAVSAYDNAEYPANVHCREDQLISDNLEGRNPPVYKQAKYGEPRIRTSFEIVENILNLCGDDSLLYVGDRNHSIARLLKASGVEFKPVLAPWSPAWKEPSADLRLEGPEPACPKKLSAVVCIGGLDFLSDEFVPAALESLRNTAPYCWALVNTTPQTFLAPGQYRCRDWWERQCFQAGFRKRPPLKDTFLDAVSEREHSEIELCLETIVSSDPRNACTNADSGIQ